MSRVSHIRGQTVHRRYGAVENSFRYSVDYLCLDPERAVGPLFFSRDWPNLFSLRARDHGGPPRQGRGAAWVRDVLAEAGAVEADGYILLLAQPRVLGHVFNPVSFWLCHDLAGGLRAVIAEVTNTFGDRHSYLCRHPDGAEITGSDRLAAEKLMHVSPFQPVEGGYVFRFDIREDRIAIGIDYQREGGGVYANLTGRRVPLTNAGILWSLVRRPFGSRRVLGLIHWQALKLWWQGARYRRKPPPPVEEVSGQMDRPDAHRKSA